MQVDEYKSGFIKEYLDSAKVEKIVQGLMIRHPQLITRQIREYKTSGYNGKMEKLRGPSSLGYLIIKNKKNTNQRKVGVLLIAAPHAREVMQPMIMLEVASQLTENFNPRSDNIAIKEVCKFLNKLNVYIIPVSNPDGLNYALYDNPLWRKTRCPIAGSTHRGVDCNRNYDYRWQESKPALAFYSGAYPFSEPETRNIRDVVEEHPEIMFVCDFHSRGEQIRRPHGIKNKKHIKQYKYFQKRIQKAIKQSRGRKYRIVVSKVVNGASDDYFYFKKGKFAFVLEDGRLYKPELTEALAVVRECTEGAKEFLKIALDWAGKNI